MADTSYNLRLPEELLDVLKDEATKKDLTLAQLVRQLLRKGIVKTYTYEVNPGRQVETGQGGSTYVQWSSVEGNKRGTNDIKGFLDAMGKDGFRFLMFEPIIDPQPGTITKLPIFIREN